MDEATEGLLRSSLFHLLSSDDGSPLGPRLAELGWDDVLADDARAALRLLFEARGTTLSPVDALGPVLVRVVAAHAADLDVSSAVVALPASLHPDRYSSVVDADSVEVSGISLSQPQPGRPVLLPLDGPDGPAVAVAPFDPDAKWSVSRLGGMDESLGYQISGSAPLSEVAWIDGSAWQEATATARWAVSTELVAIALGLIHDTVEYATSRVQYGRAIGTFQALQHRLAGAQASAVGAGDVADEASRSGRRWDAMVAKALAGRAAETACTQAQQCYGAIGFTWEHPFHRHLRRVYVLDRLFGDWRSLESEIGAELARSSSIPRVGSL